MNLEERIYSVLIVSAAEQMNTALSSLLPESHYSPVKRVATISAAKRAWSEREYDFVIINSPLPDDAGHRFAIDIGNTKNTIVLLFARAEIFDEVHEKVMNHGVFTLPKPISQPRVAMALSWMATAREKIRRMQNESLSLEDKMEEIGIINRAKWLLISELKMDEPQAHRYIEKQAMDHSLSRRAIAEEIIKTYT